MEQWLNNKIKGNQVNKDRVEDSREWHWYDQEDATLKSFKEVLSDHVERERSTDPEVDYHTLLYDLEHTEEYLEHYKDECKYYRECLKNSDVEKNRLQRVADVLLDTVTDLQTRNEKLEIDNRELKTKNSRLENKPDPEDLPW